MKKLLFIFIIILCGCSKSDTPHKTTESRDASRKAVPPAQKISESPVYETEETLGEAQTPLLDDGINRVSNINLACSRISGTALNPGEEFSFNASVGRRSYENGWLDAPVIINGEKSYGAGGGVCQVSTTLYMAAVNAGFTVTEHHSHSEPVAYAPADFDATVVYGAKDMKFVNSSENPVFLYAWTGNGKVFSKIIKKTLDNTSS